MIEVEPLKPEKDESASAIFLAAVCGSADVKVGNRSATKPCRLVKHRDVRVVAIADTGARTTVTWTALLSAMGV